MRAAVFGAGSWGTAFSVVLADGGNDVTMWARREEVAEAINSSRENPEYLPGVELPPTVSATHDVEKAAHDADVVILATPSQTLRDNLSESIRVSGELRPATYALTSPPPAPTVR